MTSPLTDDDLTGPADVTVEEAVRQVLRAVRAEGLLADDFYGSEDVGDDGPVTIDDLDPAELGPAADVLAGILAGWRAAILAEYVPAMCAEPDCREVIGVTRCESCGLPFCGRHVEQLTCADGEARHLCFDCQPGPDPVEF